MLRRFGAYFLRYRAVFLVGYLLITAFFIYTLARLEITTIFSDLFPYTHPYVKVFQQYGDSFGSPLTVSVVVEVKEGDIFNPDMLKKVRAITDSLDAIPGVNHNQVISITSPRVKRAEAVGEGIEVSALIGPNLPQTKEELEELRRRAMTTEGVFGVLASPNAKATLITANFLERLIDYRLVFERVNEVLRQEQDARYNLYAAGQPMLTGWVYYYQREMYLIFGIGLITMIGLLAFYFRNIAGIVTPVLVGGVSAIWGFGFAGLLGYNLDPLIIVIPVLLVARALSHSVQMCERYFEIYNEIGDVKRASLESLVALFPPGVVGILTDTAGLFIIAIAPIRLIEKLAYVCGLWSLSLILSVVFLSPLILSYLPPPKNVKSVVLSPDRKGGFLFRLFKIIAVFSSTPRWALATVLLFVGITLVSSWWALKLDIGHVTPGSPLLWPDAFYNLSVKKTSELFLGTDELHVIVEGDRPDAIKEPGVLKKMIEFQSHMEESPLVSGTLSIADYITTVGKYLTGGSPKWEIVPDDRRWTGSLHQMLLAGSNPGDWDRFFTPDYKNANVIVWYKDHRTETVEGALRTAKEFVDSHNANGDGVRFRLASGSIGLSAAANQMLGRLELQTVALISLVIFIITSLIYRSLTAGFLLVVISNIANAMTSAVMYSLGIGLDVNTLPIASVGMGIGIDYNIYLMSRMAEEYRRETNYEKLIPVSIFTTGKAIFFTAVTMVAGVALWYFMSSLRFQADMGLLLAAVMLAHVVLALFFQAAVMRLLRPKFITKGLLIGQKINS
jgi:predicted RND superfamily exporter protein